jgi:hypothetical protein
LWCVKAFREIALVRFAPRRASNLPVAVLDDLNAPRQVVTHSEK